MTTEHPMPAARDAGVENLFETVFKGYAKRQVEDYIAWLQEQVSAAKAELTDARRELATARNDLVETRTQLQTRPAHEEISVRMAQILRLAEEEAQQERDAGAQQAASVLEQARGEARAALEAAHANAADIVRAARRECDDELAAARAEANRLVETARRQAEGTMADARERAQRALADADRRTEQITTLQQRRLAAVLSAHEDVVRRLEAARGVIGEILGPGPRAGGSGGGHRPHALACGRARRRPDDRAATAAAVAGGTGIVVPADAPGGPSARPGTSAVAGGSLSRHRSPGRPVTRPRSMDTRRCRARRMPPGALPSARPPARDRAHMSCRAPRGLRRPHRSSRSTRVSRPRLRRTRQRRVPSSPTRPCCLRARPDPSRRHRSPSAWSRR